MKSERSRNHPARRANLLLFILLLMIAGIVITLQPYIERYEAQQRVDAQIQSFEELRISYQSSNQELSESDPSAEAPAYLTDLWQTMQDYNQEIFSNGQQDLVDAWSYSVEPFDLSQYGLDTEVVGMVSIPKIDVEMPLYLGANYTNLLSGCAVLTETSMPLGGNNTNCVIAAHRGWNEIPFVRDIEEVEIGDSIFLENLWETLEYRVVEIKVIYPWEIQSIMVQPNRDLLTLITCHPYRVNSHRYVVICERYVESNTETEGSWSMTQTETQGIQVSRGIDFQSSKTDIFLTSELPLYILIIALIVLALTIIVLILDSLRKLHKHKKKENPN